MFLLMLSHLMPVHAWWLTDLLFNKPCPQTISVQRAGKDLLAVATLVAGVSILGGYCLYSKYKKEYTKQQKIAQEKESNMAILIKENEQLRKDHALYEQQIGQVEHNYKKHERLAQRLTVYTQSLHEREINLAAREEKVKMRAAQNEENRQNLQAWQTTLNRTQIQFESMITSVSQVCKTHKPACRRAKSWGSFQTGQPLNSA